MSTANTDKGLTLGSVKDGQAKIKSVKPTSRIASVHSLMLLLALFMEMDEFQHQLFAKTLVKSFGDYIYQWQNDCIMDVNPYTGELDVCRKRWDCGYCQGVKEIDVYDSTFMTEELFIERYAKTGRPVVVRNAANGWLAMKEFSFKFFKDLYMNLNSSHTRWFENEGCQYITWGADEKYPSQLFDIEEPRAEHENGTKPWYVGWTDFCDDQSIDILRPYVSEPTFIPPMCTSRVWFFMGMPGHAAPYHMDQEDEPSWQAQIKGVKKWSLKPCPECSWSCPDEITATIYPGDVIFVHTHMWQHSTVILESGGLSISLTKEYII